MVGSMLALANDLREQVLAPLVLGGELIPVRPIGATFARAVAEAALTIVRDDLSTRMDIGRCRQSRKLAAIDAIDPVSVDEWAIAAALNDLLQATNPSMAGLGGGGARKLLAGVVQTLQQVPPVTSVREALARHGTFARLLELQRIDTTVRWWCGSAEFHGHTPPHRLLMWSRLRRVATHRGAVGLANMAQGTKLGPEPFASALQDVLWSTPLTDLLAAARTQPPFRWSDSAILLVSTLAGRTLAVRALRMSDPRQAMVSLQRASTDPSLARDSPLPAYVQAVVQDLAAWAEPQADATTSNCPPQAGNDAPRGAASGGGAP